MFVDCHCHIFTERIVANINDRPDMVTVLKLNAKNGLKRIDPGVLEKSAEANALDVCVLLPSAMPAEVRAENYRFIQMSEKFPRLRTLGTLHPVMRGLSDEIQRIFDFGINGFKFSSFSQRFDPLSTESKAMLNEVESLGRDRGISPVVVLDTFARADSYFSANPDYLTIPSKIAELVHRHQGINFIGAHMGGLLADFDELRRYLIPAPNLYLDTSNAGHTLTEDQFIELLQTHGASHILFGTDWPWFVHEHEIPKIRSLLVIAGFDESDQAVVFGENARLLFGL